MNAERLLAHYERIADAPDAITRLRRFVLDLAIRGKLVPQDYRDEPAGELLKRIAAKKLQLVKAGELKVRKEVNPDHLDNLKFPAPAGWVMTNLGAVAIKITDGAHKTPTYVERGVAFVSVKDFSAGKLELSNTRFIPETEHKILYQRCDPRRGDILIGRIGTLGKAVLVETDVEFSLFVSVGLIRFDHANIAPRFFQCLLNSPFVEAEFDRIKIGGGTHTNKLNLGDLHSVALLLPPLAEQHRIVAKVDELMALCDQLEKSRTAREETRDRLTAASLARLTDPAPETFQTDARFALDALPSMTARPDQIKRLRQTLLGLAVMGKLTTQEVRGPDAREELRLVEARKLANKVKRPKNIAPIENDEHWGPLPSRWEWARWDEVSDWITYGFTRPMPHEKSGVPIITGKNVNGGKVIFETAHFTSIEAFEALNEKDRPKLGDILVTKDGSIGRTAIVSGNRQFCINQSVAVIWLRSCHFVRRFLQLALDCPQTQHLFLSKTEGVAIKHISVVDLGRMIFPVPPLSEQHRIVAKIDELMTLCDHLEASLTAGETARNRLLYALLHEALEPSVAMLEAVA